MTGESWGFHSGNDRVQNLVARWQGVLEKCSSVYLGKILGCFRDWRRTGVLAPVVNPAWNLQKPVQRALGPGSALAMVWRAT